MKLSGINDMAAACRDKLGRYVSVTLYLSHFYHHGNHTGRSEIEWRYYDEIDGAVIFKTPEELAEHMDGILHPDGGVELDVEQEAA